MTDISLEKRTVIFGFHNPEEAEMLKMYLEFEGYAIQESDTLEGMKQLIESHPGAKGYWMDINLGVSYGSDASSSIQVYEMIKERVNTGKAMFLAMTSSPDAYDNAIKAGISEEYAMMKPAPSLKALIDRQNHIQ